MTGGNGSRSAPGGATPPPVNVQRVLSRLDTVVDPERGRSIIALGLVRGVHIHDQGMRVVVDMTLASPRCPHGLELVWATKRALRGLPGVRRAEVRLEWGVRWAPDREPLDLDQATHLLER